MTVEVMSRDLRYSGKPGRSFRKSKEDLALFESINDLPDSKDLDSCLADVEPNALAGDQLLEKDVSDSDADKNDDDWLVPAPEVSVSPQSHPSNLIISRNLSAIKTTRSAALEPTRASDATPQRNPSPRVYKGPQDSKVSPSRIPRFNPSASNSAVRKSSPGPTLIPRAASSPRASTPSAIPRASSSPRTTSSASGIRQPSPKSKWTTSGKTTPMKATPQTPKSTSAARGSSPKFTRASTTSPSTAKGKKLVSSNYGSTRTSTAKEVPSQPGSARSVKSVGPSQSAVKAAKPSFAYKFLSETPANLRTDPFTKRPAGSSSRSLHARSLSRSYDGPSHSGSPSSVFQDYTSRSQDRGPSDLSRSQDRGPGFQYSGSKGSTSDGLASTSDEDFPTSIPGYGGGIGRRTLKKNDGQLQSLGRETVLYQPDKSTAEDSSYIMGRSSMILDPSCSTGYTAQAQSSLNSKFGFRPFMTNSSIPSFSQHRKLLDPEFEAPQPVSTVGAQDACDDVTPTATKSSAWDVPKNRMEEPGSSADETSIMKRIQMGFALRKEYTELPTMDNLELSTTAMVSQVEDKGPVKVYQGLGNLEDMEDMGGNWCCGMADRYRGLCKQHDCVIFKNFHTALVLNNASSQPCSSTSGQGSLNDKSGSDSDSDEEAVPEHSFDENKPSSKPIDSTPISEFLKQLSPNDVEAGDRGSSSPSSCASSDRSASSRAEVDGQGRRGNGKETTIWRLKGGPEDTPPPVETEPRRSKTEKGEPSGKKNTAYKWDLDITEPSSRPRELGKPPDFFDVTKRNEDGGVVAAISSVKSLSASDDDDPSKFVTTRSSSSSSEAPLNRSSSMNGSHVSHSDTEDEEELHQTFSPESDADLARSDSEVKSDENSPRELMSEFSRASSTKSNVRRFFSTSATSIDLTRSVDTTCSTQSPYEYNIWEEPSDSGRYGYPMARPPPQKSEPSKAPEVEPAASVYDYGLEKLAGYIRSASVNARKRRASVTSSESDQSKISLSRESSFDYFVDFFEAQTNLDPEARAVADLLVSAHIEAKRVELNNSPGNGGTTSTLKRASSFLSSSSLRSEKSVEVEHWESNKSVQSLENSRDGAEQIVENATHASLDKHFSSFKFGQKKYPAGEFESITTLEVVPESPPSDSGLSPSRRKYSKRFNEMIATIPEPSPICQKFLKEIEEQQNLCEGIALSALKSAPLDQPVVRKLSVEQVWHPKEEEAKLPAESHPKCESLRVSTSITDPCNENQVVAADVEIEKDKAQEEEKAKVKAPDEEPESQLEIEKAMVEQVLLAPVPNQMSKGPKDTPVMSPVRMASTSPTKRAGNGHEVGDNNEKTCGCTIL